MCRIRSRGVLLGLVVGLLPTLAAAQAARPVTATKNSPSYAIAAEEARQLSAESRDVFLRGLMPLPDYLEHLSVIYEAQARNTLDKLNREARSKLGYESNQLLKIDTNQCQK